MLLMLVLSLKLVYWRVELIVSPCYVVLTDRPGDETGGRRHFVNNNACAKKRSKCTVYYNYYKKD